MTTAAQWVHDKGRRRLRDLTPLNLATSARYAKCRGHHIPSGQTVTRWFPGSDRVLHMCRACRVPFGAPKANWSSGTSRPRGPKLPGSLPSR